ncbi:hypothetical protein BRADI_3g59815v3 [Brachypodium distachyon]|uniref:Uncharacterized protein n=1 Tax=Brachypodium distachyon TaxID=15368 RepID=A0A2K2D5W6_BRADI|nr:hypothetical protein BRADI_3g59815v3 [Brachypodium distachyon]
MDISTYLPTKCALYLRSTIATDRSRAEQPMEKATEEASCSTGKKGEGVKSVQPGSPCPATGKWITSNFTYTHKNKTVLLVHV